MSVEWITVRSNALLMWIVRDGESLRSAWMVICGNWLLAGIDVRCGHMVDGEDVQRTKNAE